MWLVGLVSFVVIVYLINKDKSKIRELDGYYICANEKITRRFAWLPTKVDGNIKIWLQTYYAFRTPEYGAGLHDGWRLVTKARSLSIHKLFRNYGKHENGSSSALEVNKCYTNDKITLIVLSITDRTVQCKIIDKQDPTVFDKVGWVINLSRRTFFLQYRTMHPDELSPTLRILYGV